ncbi:MAG TPA: TonB-dependent receptor, partial [Prolixibacteraceae bacterium]|nr:TonB-dependent receptor [Prolixibacteraceae bacterium]
MKVNILSIFLILVTTTVSRAQDMAEEADTARIRNLNIEEITIKSTKYNSDIFYVPAAATKLSSQVIVNSKIENLTDLSGLVPNFFMPDYGSKLTSPVYIRGIGTRINSPSVGLYVDNIPYFEKSAFNFDFFDIESIDVLRGPQGTLYGRNTLAGLINITTRQPGKERNGSVVVDYGNYNQVKTQLSYNQPLTDKMAVILNAGQVHHDGFFTNQYNGKKADKLNSYSGRMKFNYDVCSAFNTQLTLQYENSRQGGYPYALYNKTTQQAGEVNYDSPSSYDRDLFSAGWAMNADLGSVYISSATSYQYL